VAASIGDSIGDANRDRIKTEKAMVENPKISILMVDDQPAKLLSYEVMLAELGENLIRASSAKEALEQLLKVDVAVVLMDVSMPELDGFELANMIRQHPRFQRTAIIFISAVHLSDLDRLKGYEHGAVDYISIPVIPELLRAKVKVFAELHRKTRQLETLNRELERRVEERTKELADRSRVLQTVNIQLMHRNQELDAIFRTAPDIIFSRQADGSRDYISPRFYDYTGAASGSATGEAWEEYLHPEDKARVLDVWAHSVESGENYEVEYRLRAKDKTYRWFRARAVPIKSEDGKIVKWYGTCSDIQDSKVLEQSIRDSATELEKMVDSRTAELRRLSVRLMTLQDQEHRRIARDLHDGLGQELAVAKMVLDNALHQTAALIEKKACAEASTIIDRAIQQVRTMSHLLHPPLLDEVGLLSALTWYADGLTERSGIETALEVQPQDFPRLAPELETAIFRIVQEALTNVFRHSQASQAWINVAQTDSRTVITVRDNGVGINDRIAELQPDSVGVGIGGIKQRAKEFGGELRVFNANPGTTVEVVIPSSAGPLLPETDTVLQESKRPDGPSVHAHTSARLLA
jgi:PAS domain S-box-containing protein